MKKIDDKYFIKKEGVNYNLSIEDSLNEGEKILWKSKPYRKSFILSSVFKFALFGIIWLGFDVFFIVMIVRFASQLPWFVYIFFAIFFMIHLFPVWLWIANIISASRRQKMEEYAFTSTRIIVKKGFIGANIESYFYSSITSVNLKIGLVERMCKVGDIYIVAQNQKVILEDIKDPYFIYSKLQKIANDIKSDIIYPNSLRPKENHGYKTSYKIDDDFNK